MPLRQRTAHTSSMIRHKNSENLEKIHLALVWCGTFYSFTLVYLSSYCEIMLRIVKILKQIGINSIGEVDHEPIACCHCVNKVHMRCHYVSHHFGRQILSYAISQSIDYINALVTERWAYEPRWFHAKWIQFYFTQLGAAMNMAAMCFYARKFCTN